MQKVKFKVKVIVFVFQNREGIFCCQELVVITLVFEMIHFHFKRADLDHRVADFLLLLLFVMKPIKA